LILAFLKSNEKLTNSVYRRLNHVDSLPAGQELRGLVQANLLAQHGGKRGTYYTLAVTRELPDAPTAVTDEDRILEFVRVHGSINNAECRELLRVSDEQARYLLARKLVSGGKLLRQGSGKKTKYVLTDL